MATEKAVLLVIRASRPTFNHNHDRIAFVVHSSFLASGFILTAAGPPAFHESAFSFPSFDEVGIDGWNERDGDYAFVYVNPEKGLKKVLVKCLKMNDILVVDALEQGSSEPVHLEIRVADHIGEEQGSDYSVQYKNLDKLVKSLNKEILSKLNPPAADTSSDKSSSSEVRERSESYPHGVEYPEPQSPETSPYGFVIPPLPVGPASGSDILPGLPAGIYPTRGGDRGGSMLIGPNDPRWVGGPGGAPGFGGRLPPGVPPGARFDPFGPPDVPGFEPDRFTRQPRRPGGGPPHPDLQHFPGGSDFI